tara:strand:- start:926 stop:1639 length:714 start_codon:yes stop_codon:yes gene_type:complete
MSESNNKKREIDLGDDFNVAVTVNGARIEVATDGSILAYTNSAVRVLPVSNDDAASDNSATAPENFEIGQMVAGKGVFVGTYEPADRQGRSFGKTFNLFAAPDDLTDGEGKKVLLTFNKAVKHVVTLKDWHGFDGGNLRNDTAVYDAVRNDPKALENWFIPTKDIVERFYGHKDDGAFKGTFVDNFRGHARWYWSCTEHREDASSVCAITFTLGVDGWVRKDNFRLSTRPVRAELRL